MLPLLVLFFIACGKAVYEQGDWHSCLFVRFLFSFVFVEINSVRSLSFDRFWVVFVFLLNRYLRTLMFVFVHHKIGTFVFVRCHYNRRRSSPKLLLQSRVLGARSTRIFFSNIIYLKFRNISNSWPRFVCMHQLWLKLQWP